MRTGVKTFMLTNLTMFILISVIAGCSHSQSFQPVIVADLADPKEATVWDVPKYTPTPEFQKLVKRKNPISVWRNNDESRVYRVDIDSGMLTIIERFSPDSYIEKQIFVGFGAVGVIANKMDTVAYVTNMKTGTVAAVMMDSKSINKSVFTGNKPYCLIFNKSQTILYVASRLGDRVFKIDPDTLQLLGETSIHNMDLDVKNTQCASCHESRDNGSNLYIQAKKPQQNPMQVNDWLKDSGYDFNTNVIQTGLRK